MIFKRIASCALIAGLALGCARETVWQVHNATTGPIQFTTKDSKTPIDPGASAEVTIDGASFDVISGANDWFYVKPEFPEEFVKFSALPWQNSRGAMAVTQEGKIFLLLPTSTALPDKAPKQPRGFPIGPFANGGDNKPSAEDFLNAIRK